MPSLMYKGAGQALLHPALLQGPGPGGSSSLPASCVPPAGPGTPGSPCHRSGQPDPCSYYSLSPPPQYFATMLLIFVAEISVVIAVLAFTPFVSTEAPGGRGQRQHSAPQPLVRFTQEPGASLEYPEGYRGHQDSSLGILPHVVAAAGNPC